MNSQAIYELLLDAANDHAKIIEEVLLGLTWTLCRADGSIGLAMSPALQTRTLPWSGRLVGQSTTALISWLRSWQMHEAVVGMAAINATLNHTEAALDLQAQATQLAVGDSANLAVFDYFLPRLHGQKVVVIGRYPGLETYAAQLDLTVLERHPNREDLPDQACEYLLPEADWVFLTASSLPNKTFPRLLELSQSAVVVLMGPGTPWLPQLNMFGIDFLAGVTVQDATCLRQTVAEGGGVRIFAQGVSYAVADIGQPKLERLKSEISGVATRRQNLNTEMEQWYNSGHTQRFPAYQELEAVSQQLSGLDTRYKRLWDAHYAKLKS